MALGVAAIVALAVPAVLVTMHTRWGRELVRAQVESKLAATFVGGATLGGFEGNPFGTMTLSDLVIHGPDRTPAITIKTLQIEVGILPLLSQQARVLGVLADGLDVDLRRDATGELAIKRLLRPGPSSNWSVDLPKVVVRNGHLRIDTGTERLNFDGLALDAWAKLPHGGPIDAGLDVRGAWRERQAAALALATVLHSDKAGLALPFVTARAGEVRVIGNQVTIRPAARDTGASPPAARARLPVIAGAVFVDAGVDAVARLVPGLRLPADLALQVTARPLPGQTWSQLEVVGRVDQAPVRLTATADLDARHARGELAAGELDVTRLTGGKLTGRAGGTVVFDARPGEPGALPTATATIRGFCELAGIPRTALDIAVSSAGERARARVQAKGNDLDAELTAAIHSAGERLAIEDAVLHVAASDPARASGGKAPVHGRLRIDLKARGPVRPAPALAVTGTISGQRLRVADLSVSALHVAVDAKQLPNRPFGHARVQLVDLVRRDMQLGEVTVEATDRSDGKIAVTMRSRPRQNPWLVDADALVTPPAKIGLGRVAVDVVHHRVRAGSGAEWTGTTGHLDITPDRIALRDLASQSEVGSLAIAASYDRAGRGQGDMTANVDLRSLALENLTDAYHGKLDAHIAVSRQRGAWQGEVQLDGRRVSFDPSETVVDAQLHAALHGRRLTIAAGTSSLELGSVRLAFDADTPAQVTDPAGWKRLGADAIRTAELTLRGVDLRRAAELAGMQGDYAGTINGDVALTQGLLGGRIEAREVLAPGLRGIPVTAVVEVAQRAPTEVTPKLTVTAAELGTAVVQADLEAPARLFDPAAWHQLGRRALRGASVRAEGIAIEPGLLDRFGVTSQLRGRGGVTIDIGPAMSSVQAAIDVAELRGGDIVQPVDVRLTAAIDDRATTSTLTATSGGNRLLELTGDLPLALPQLIDHLRDRRQGPAALRALPLSATATLAAVDAPRLLAVVGRTEITSGKIDGTVQLRGTLGAPTATAKLVATRLTIPPGPRGKPVRIVDRLTIDGGWDGAIARLAIDGAESAGGTLQLTAQVSPERLRDATVTIRAKKFDLVPLLVFAPGPAGGAAGELDADLRLTGLDLRTAQIAGELHLRGARIPTAPTVGTLRAATIDAIIADHEVRLRVDGKLGAGTAQLDGTIALDGAAPNGGKAKLVLRKVSPIGSVEPQITANVDATLTRERNQWRAQLVVDRGYVVVPSDRGEKLKPVGAPTDMVFTSGERVTRRPMAHEAPVRPIFVIGIDLRRTRVESEEFRGLVRGKLEVRADGDAVAIYGSVDAERGDLDLFSRRYQVERAGVHFDGPPDPLLDIRITHDFPEVTTVTEVRGRASKPELIMTSDPGSYSQGQLLGFLLGGEPGGDPQSGPLQSQVAGAGESYVANQIGGYVKKALPIDIDVLRYEAATSNSSAAVTVGSWINTSLFIAYRQHLESRPDENTGEGELEYWLTPRLVIEGTVGNRGYDGVDLLWRKRY